jgi:hypothetical protein
MLIGIFCGSVCLVRSVIHASSCQSYRDSVTTEAVAGGHSVARARGSAFVRR